jgi:hypothetical protein
MALPQATVVGVADTTAVVVAFGSFAHLLPDIAAGMSIVFMTFRFCVWSYKAIKKLRR